jgi:hypothetical protein
MHAFLKPDGRVRIRWDPTTATPNDEIAMPVGILLIKVLPVPVVFAIAGDIVGTY